VRRQPVHLLALAALSALAPIALLVYLGGDKVYLAGWVHVVCVGIGAAITTVAALALTVAGARQQDGRSVLVGVAFSVMASLLFLHGLTTPYVWFATNGVVALTGGLTIPLGGAILALSALPAVARPSAVKPLLWLLACAVVAILGLGVAALVDPALVPGVPEARSWEAWLLLAAGLAFYGVLALRALRTFRLTHRRSDLAVVVGIVWLAAAMAPALTQDYWNVGWWVAHGLELAGIALVAVPVALDLRRGSTQSRPLAGDMSAVQLVLHEEAYLGSHVRALLVSLAASDSSTEEHTRRVALRAVEVGEELGLSSTRLRELALGGLLHDIGKLATPTEILRKPGRLTDAEFAEVRLHPVGGDALLRDLGGFPSPVLRLVRHHHERLDGSGYPDGLGADDLPLDTRILAVCDVYDALVSDRVYRGAWSHEQAFELLREATQFDQRCVDALQQVLGRQHGQRPAVVLPAPARRRPAGALTASPSPTQAAPR
jgi:hypothetical protein